MTQDFDNRPMQASRLAGVCTHITSLPGPYGIGEIGRPALDFIERLRDMNLAVWQFLPLGPTAFGDSPYQPLSTFAGNELLIDIGDLVERGLLDWADVADLTRLPKDFVDFGALIPIKARLLEIAAERIQETTDSGFVTAYRQFVEKFNDQWLHDYALFRILKTQHDERPWPEWQSEFAHRNHDALRRLETEAAEQIEHVKIIQFLFHQQWRDLRKHASQHGISLFGDMPIYVALDSADAWANRDLLQISGDGQPRNVAGVPADYFSEDGQLWGNPLYAWENHAASGFQWWIERLRATAELMDIVRIDHFRGFEAYWSVQAGSENARFGTWEPGPGDAIFQALRDALGDLPIVAEDLGVITPAVDALRERHGIPGMRVLQFDVTDPGFDLSNIASDSVCYTGTHDNDTTIGWYHGSPDDVRTPEEIRAAQHAALRITNGTPETIHLDMIRAAFATRAGMAIAPMQDYLGLGSESRLNTPGTSNDNWRWRILDTQLTGAVCDNVAAMIETAGRAPG